MRTLERTTRFKKDYRREKKTNPLLDKALVPVLELLLADVQSPERLIDHQLTGEWKGFRDCHVKPDLVLIYEKPEGLLRLVRLGSHSELY